MELCKVSGCQRPVWVRSKALCSAHYNRLRVTGTTADGPRARADLSERFWRYVKKGSANECWPWIGKSTVAGYGYIGAGGRSDGKILAHRLSWEIHKRRIPTSKKYHGSIVMHACDNRLCVNPAHLRLGTQVENVHDMDRKGRRVTNPPLGSKHHNAKFTEDEVKVIRASSARTNDLAKRYGVNRHTISAIKKRKVWKHVV